MSTAFGIGEIPEIGLPQRLLLARNHAHLNQTELADLMGISRKTVANAEGGIKTPLTMTLRAWAHATGVDAEWLETGENPRQNGPGGGEECPQSGSNRRPADYKSVQIVDISRLRAPERLREAA